MAVYLFSSLITFLGGSFGLIGLDGCFAGIVISCTISKAMVLPAFDLDLVGGFVMADVGS